MKLIVKKSEWLYGTGSFTGDTTGGRLHDKDLNKSCVMGHYLLNLGYTKEEIATYRCIDTLAYHLSLEPKPGLEKMIHQPDPNRRFYSTTLANKIEIVNDKLYKDETKRINKLKELFKTIDVDLEIID